MIQLLLSDPTSLTMVSLCNGALINVDHSQSRMKGLNEFQCCILSLKLGWSIVVGGVDSLHQPISGCQLAAHISPKEWTTYFQSALFDQRLLDIS